MFEKWKISEIGEIVMFYAMFYVYVINPWLKYYIWCVCWIFM